jgi:hypothetical protein
MAIIPDSNNADVVATYNYLRLFKMMSPMMPAGMPKMDMPSKSNLVFAAKVRDGSVALDIALPKEHLSEMMMAFQMMQMQQMKQAPPAAPKKSSIDNSPKGPPTEVIKSYIVAASKLDPSATKVFLSRKCDIDMVTEFQANYRAGWTLSEPVGEIEIESINTKDGTASVKTKILFVGGNVSMVLTRTFFLVLEDDAWKVSGMEPPPKNEGPGFKIVE